MDSSIAGTQLSEQIYDLMQGQESLYLRTEPEVPDFTANLPFRIFIYNKNQKLEIEVFSENLILIFNLLKITIFTNEFIKYLYCWNIKSLCSYFTFFTSKFLFSDVNMVNVIDLKVIENFLGIRKNHPESLPEVINRTRIVIQNKNWKTIYKQIHLPLSLKVLPLIETTPLINTLTRKSEYPYYEIEGQQNGRMNCVKKFTNGYLAHNMSPDIKRNMKPKGYNLSFILPDYRYCEVVVLQWLTKDEVLKDILDSGLDVHKRIYELITNNPCDTPNKRSISKKMFLPVMFGCGPKGLADNLKITEDVAKELYRRICIIFKQSAKWMFEKQKAAAQGVICDYFGRPRQYPQNESYRARNGMVQGVAATVCQEKLIQLSEKLNRQDAKIAFSVHDGFGLVCDTEKINQVSVLVNEVLSSESVLCPGLKMEVEIKTGTRLDALV
jgi:hypothetical protein